MRYTIVHEIPGRVRVDLLGRMCDHDAASVMELMARLDCVAKCAVYPRTGTLAISYVGGPAERELVLDALALLKLETIIDNRVETLSLAINEDVAFIGDVAGLILKRLFKRMFLPPVIRHIWTVFSAIHFFRLAAKSLAKPALEVATLDAAAIAVSLIRRDFSTASTTMFLLRLGEIMQDHTIRRSQMALVDSLLDVPSDAWRVGTDGVEELVATDDIEVGDLIRVRMGSRIPLDGRIVAGTADVNQATLTGEALAVRRETGDSVFAGTVVESGEVTIEATTLPRETKLRQVVALVEQSDSLKSQRQSNMEHMADRLVPWYFLTSGLVYAVTRDPVRASAALMVDYSCVLKLSGSIAALSAMSQGVEHGFTVKGARWFEAVAEADTLVFDKTGTLTEGRPIVADVIPLNHWSVTNVLRLAACLEEHFPHPVARAVVNEAAARGIEHRERHAEVEYVVAHGIASHINGKRAIIGSGHFVFEDEGVGGYDELLARYGERMEGTSPLYLAVNGRVVGIVCISDPLRPGISGVLDELRGLGFERIIMLTGDNARTAARIAAEAGIDEFCADMLPEAKHAYLEELRATGHKVVMVGDGVNDTPALALADVGIAMGDGAAIAREVADITLSGDGVRALCDLRRMSTAFISRMAQSSRFAIGFNTAVLALGIFGVITPTLSSAAHNISTVALSIGNARRYLPET